jgi:hypothetical protein
MVPGDGSYEKLEHQTLFLRERGLTSPEMEECNRRLWLFTRLAGGDSTKLDPRFVDRIHVELAGAAVKQMKATGLFEEWLDSWDAHNGIEIDPAKEHKVPALRVHPEPTTAIDGNPGQRLIELAAEHSLRALGGEHVAVISEAAEERH